MVQLYTTNHQRMVTTLCLPEPPSGATLGSTDRDPFGVFAWQMDLQDTGINQLHSAFIVMNIYQILSLSFHE